jgi:hypothetical protein
MVAALTTDDLVTEVRDEALLPDTDGRLGATEAATDVAICRLASRVLRTVCAELVVGARAQRWTTDLLNSGGGTAQVIVSGTYLYDIPTRALAAGVSDVLILSVDGSTITEWSAPEVPAAEAWRYANNHGGWDSPYAYCWRDDQIELLPHPTATEYLVHVYYPRGLLRLVPTASCALIASKTATTITTSATVPSGWASSETLDIVRGSPNGQPRGIDQAGTSISGTSITISAGVPSGTVAGDYVCLDGETCVPPVPDVVWPVLVDGAALEVLRAIGDPAGTQDAERRLGESVRSARALLEPRSRGASKKIVARYSPLRRGWWL